MNLNEQPSLNWWSHSGGVESPAVVTRCDDTSDQLGQLARHCQFVTLCPGINVLAIYPPGSAQRRVLSRG